jgi:hypothetical protein
MNGITNKYKNKLLLINNNMINIKSIKKILSKIIMPITNDLFISNSILSFYTLFLSNLSI